VGTRARASAGPVAAPQIDVHAAVAMSRELAGGRIEVRRFAIEGIPLIGAFEVVHEDDAGRSRTLAARRPTAPAELGIADVRVDGASAARVAMAAGPASTRDAAPEGPARLVYRMILGTPVLAWEVQLPLSLRPEPSRRMLWISASSGVVLDERENVFASRARVFAENPSVTPEPIEVALTDIDATGPGVPLVGDRVRSFNCVTTPPVEVQPWHDEGDCWAVSRTFSDAAGDFFVPLPDPIDPATGVDGDDLYAELSMYVHAERFMNVMAERGVTPYRCEQSTMLANVRFLPEDDAEPYEPLNNAYYTDQCDPEKGVTMMFGQGSEVDFAFDADVIYHELGHGIVALLAPEGLVAARRRADGLVVDATAINEAMADYVTVMFQEDPDLAEYVGRFWESLTTPYIRTALNTKRCPDDTIGQSHNDGEPLMAALWATRVHVGRALDDVVLGALPRLPDDATLEEASAALLEVAGERVDAGALGADDVALLERQLNTRGLLDCPRVITDPDQVIAGRTMHLRKVSASVQPFWPGPMQLRYQVPDDAHGLTVTFELSGRGSEDPPQAAVLLKRGATPIAFTYDLVARDDAGDPTGASGKVRELTLVGGDWERRIDATRTVGDAHEVAIGGLQPGEVVHLSVVATAAVDAVATDVRVVDDRSDDAGSSSGETADHGGASGGAGREDVHGEGATASCACASASDPVAAPWVALLVLPALRRRRRR
jgi:MYXO-CTERM domain-containing protein